MKPLLVEILDSILRTNGKLAYVINCDGEDLVSFTRDTSLACNQKEGDEYVGVNAVDEAKIEIWTWKEFESRYEDYIGFIYWTNFNDGIERVVDYNVSLDEKYGLDKTLDDWEKKYELL
tara:strand:- start:67 stop:423 length:357 start_codon:yes stop_codon:yes gene_type:complete